jgi:hypothetical protein
LHHPQTGKTDLSLELAGLKAAELPIRQVVKIEFLIETVGTEIVGREGRANFCSRETRLPGWGERIRTRKRLANHSIAKKFATRDFSGGETVPAM